MTKIDNNKYSDSFWTEQEKKYYNSWRLRILIFIIIGYGAYYLCRQNFAMIIPALTEEFDYSKTQIGIILSSASIIYGIGKFINGYISDRSNARYFMPIGLFISSMITFTLGFVESIYAIGFLWVANNWFQSMGWPPAARIISHWFAPSELGKKWALGAASHQIGGAFTLIISGYIVAHYGWRYAFMVPAVIAIIISVLLFTKLRESPKILGLPPVEAYKGVTGYKYVYEQDNISSGEIFQKVFFNKNMWLICLANACVYIVRSGVIFWAPLFLSELRGISIEQAGLQIAIYEASGLFGGICAGYISDLFYQKKRGIVGAIFMLILAILIGISWQLPEENNVAGIIILFLMGFFVYGPQVLIGVSSVDFASKKAIGTANGLAGTMGYVGSAISGAGVGCLIDNYGWYSVFIFFIVSSLLGSLFFLMTVCSDVEQL
ncbi:MAG: MFS transporter [Rickettsiaceae bacterium]|nr:MFS transporter [Rickettsiaceae bacterium]